MPSVTFKGETDQTTSWEGGYFSFHFNSRQATLELDNKTAAEQLSALRSAWKRSPDGKCSLLVQADNLEQMWEVSRLSLMYDYAVSNGVSPVEALSIILK